ncbi:NAD(P)H-hydrate epimerase [Chironomus tepperi]|uniref:NAD(P)H-hydrate epimerase n=1 Tax=Chironomus tepperi TaxID=113505 RepID=UPI00391F7FA5
MLLKYLNNFRVVKTQILKQNIHKLSTMKYLTQDQAINVDLELFNEYKFSVDQLMELAGLSCAHAIAKEFPIKSDEDKREALIVVGPGNNGGDGLVLARHLSLMKFKPSVYYPKRVDKPLYNNLVKQCELMDIPFIDSCPTVEASSKYRFIADGLFGFSFKPPVRDTFTDVMKLMCESKSPVCCIDIPSGWNVENGPGEGDAIKPYMLISLTAPKLCAKNFNGVHYLGGRFVPPRLSQKYQMDLPEYPGTELCVKLN